MSAFIVCNWCVTKLQSAYLWKMFNFSVFNSIFFVSLAVSSCLYNLSYCNSSFSSYFSKSLCLFLFTPDLMTMRVCASVCVRASSCCWCSCTCSCLITAVMTDVRPYMDPPCPFLPPTPSICTHTETHKHTQSQQAGYIYWLIILCLAAYWRSDVTLVVGFFCVIGWFIFSKLLWF